VENVLPTLLAIAVIVFGATSAYSATNSTVDDIARSWKAMADVAEDRQRTVLSVTGTAVEAGGEYVQVTVANSGQEMVTVFSRLDVIVEYTDSGAAAHIAYLDYVAGSPAAGEWTVMTISNDVFDPGLLNPGEAMVIRLRVDELESGTTNRVTIVSPNGNVATATIVYTP
jgi:archaellum component FlaF (FlaF/FlaG flagellin family)